MLTQVRAVRPISLVPPVPLQDLPAVRRRPKVWLQRHGGVLFAGLAGAVAAVVHDAADIAVAVIGLGLWMLTVVVYRATSTAAAFLRSGQPVMAAAFAFAVVAAATTVGVLPSTGLAPTLTALFVATGLATVWLGVQRLHPPIARTVLVGEPDALEAEATLWAEQPGVDLVACVPWTSDDIDEPEGIATLIRAHRIDTVIIAADPQPSAEKLQRFCWELESTDAGILLGGLVDRLSPHRLAAGTFAGLPVIAVGPSRRSWLQQAFKSAFDRVVAGLLLVLVSPLIAVAALAVRLESPGAALFRQRRVGHNGQPFVMYKLRTMHASGDLVAALPLQRTAGNEVLFKMRDDPRVTRVGRVLRRYSIDELPQLINVVRGDMALIGPRPALYEETKKYDSHAWRRTAVKPGITGLWQVSGRSDLSWERSIDLDVHYVDNWRLADDLTIAAKTLRALVSKKGAY